MKKTFLSKAENILDIQKGTIANLPNIIIYGTSCAEIDNFRSLLDFSQNSARINTSDGIVKIDGENLKIPFMTDESVKITGNIRLLAFE
ncbi:MAG: YabP/YqfC family sporulation protein [Clostridia bacterium]